MYQGKQWAKFRSHSEFNRKLHITAGWLWEDVKGRYDTWTELKQFLNLIGKRTGGGCIYLVLARRDQTVCTALVRVVSKTKSLTRCELDRVINVMFSLGFITSKSKHFYSQWRLDIEMVNIKLLVEIKTTVTPYWLETEFSYNIDDDWVKNLPLYLVC